MKKRSQLLLLFIAFGNILGAQSSDFVNPSMGYADLLYYLPDNYTYNEEIPRPSDVLGFEVGEWHARPDQIVQYMLALAASSDRVSIIEYARSYEQRPLILLTISSEKNQAKMDEIREAHLKLSDPNESRSQDISKMPAVVWEGFSVHGNEPSGSNASLLVAYHLAAAEGPEMENLLNNLVILLDPMINPDGLGRFAQWANSHKSVVLDPNSDSREHNEVWPRGRTNHYWFDLNRDWLLQQHPESRGRLVEFHRWKPNVLTDHHEMGTNSTFFFQPGIPSRNNPLTPKETFELTEKIGAFHADRLDGIKSLYYTKESFDDFYYGKGSTYPDINGGVGILFEQASARGHLQESQHGNISFPFAIKNQFSAALSTIEAASELRMELLEHQRNFFKTAIEDASRSEIKAYLFGNEFDRGRNEALLNILLQHRIEVRQLKRTVQFDGYTYHPGSAYLVPTEQPQYRLIRALFEKVREFPDSLFYDVSSWTLPPSFDLPYKAMSKRELNGLMGNQIDAPEGYESRIEVSENTIALAYQWDHYYAPAITSALLRRGIKIRLVNTPTSVSTAFGKADLMQGAMIIHFGIQNLSRSELIQQVRNLAQKFEIEVHAVETGQAVNGPDLGSPSMDVLQNPTTALLVGEGVSSYEAGEVWHLLDARLNIPLTLLPKSELNGRSLNPFNRLVMVNGRYSDLNEREVDAIKDWVRNGGVLITQKSGTNWASAQGLGAATFKSSPDADKTYRAYDLLDRINGAQNIGGSIYNNTIDPTHPLGYGYRDGNVFVFRNSESFMELPANPSAAPLRYTESPLVSGYSSKENLEFAKNTAGVVVTRLGSGRVIQFTDNHNFRAFWWGSNKLFLNALFFGPYISGSSTE